MKNKSMISANLTGKVVLITGASSGLGAYYAEMLSNNNATVIVSGRDIEKINKVIGKIKNAYALQLDMCDFKSFNRKVNEIVHQYGSIDVFMDIEV